MLIVPQFSNFFLYFCEAILSQNLYCAEFIQQNGFQGVYVLTFKCLFPKQLQNFFKSSWMFRSLTYESYCLPKRIHFSQYQTYNITLWLSRFCCLFFIFQESFCSCKTYILSQGFNVFLKKKPPS